ncbi:FecR family protein [Prevotella sp. 10(H)]|uniref:FecR family protein n=1 Tax=Prevotella sp. 10(H) TaxID=1158294 RepID=UPI0018CC6224|nr:FecR family protein [Prevotella sp. 10(H)]
MEKYFSKNISIEDKEKMFSMIMESPSYKDQYEKAAKLNTLLHISSFDSFIDDDYLLLQKRGAIYSENRLDNNKAERFSLWRKIAVAVILILFSSSGSIYLYERLNNQGEIVSLIETSTPLGGQTRLILPDGSVAWINAKSELKYNSNFGKNNRDLLLNGEAYFEVNKNEELPFSVSAGDMKVVATGTQFNVRSYPDDYKWEVSLLEGGINVSVSDKHFALIPDEKIIYNKTSGELLVEKTDAEMATQWTKGKLSFYQASISEIYKMLERHFNVRIEIESEELKEEYFLGSINLEMSLSEILSYLDVDKKYKIQLKDEVIIIRKK